MVSVQAAETYPVAIAVHDARPGHMSIERRGGDQWKTAYVLMPEEIPAKDPFINDPIGVTLKEEHAQEGRNRRVVVEIVNLNPSKVDASSQDPPVIFRMILLEVIRRSMGDREQFEAELSAIGVDLTQLDAILSNWIQPPDESMAIPWLKAEDSLPNGAVFTSAHPNNYLS